MSSSVDGAVSVKLHAKLEPNNVDDKGAAKYNNLASIILPIPFRSWKLDDGMPLTQIRAISNLVCSALVGANSNIYSE